jgi:hypothetical protein
MLVKMFFVPLAPNRLKHSNTVGILVIRNRKKERGKGNQNNVEEDKRERREKERNPQKKFLFPARTTQNGLPFPALTPPTIVRRSTPLFIGTVFAFNNLKAPTD